MLKLNSYITIMILLMTVQSFAGDADVGNGGDAVVCRDANDKITSAELLDYYEARVHRGIIPNIGSKDLAVNDKIKILIERLSKVSPYRAKEYQKFANEFKDKAKFISGIVLIDIKDSDHNGYPRGCEVEQVIIYEIPQFPEDKPYTVSMDIYEALDNDSRAGLILHEAIYYEALQAGHNNSRKTRYFNSLIAADKLKDHGTKSLFDLITSTVSLEYFEYNGDVLWHGGLSFYKDSDQIESANFVNCSSCTINVAGNAIPYSSIHSVYYYKSGQYKDIYIVRPTHVTFNIENQNIDLKLTSVVKNRNNENNSCVLSLFENGQPKSFCLVQQTENIVIERLGQKYLRSLGGYLHGADYNYVHLDKNSNIEKAKFNFPKDADFIEPYKWLGEWRSALISKGSYTPWDAVGSEGVGIQYLTPTSPFTISTQLGEYSYTLLAAEDIGINSNGYLNQMSVENPTPVAVVFGEIEQQLPIQKFSFNENGVIDKVMPYSEKPIEINYKGKFIPKTTEISCFRSQYYKDSLIFNTIKVWPNGLYNEGCSLLKGTRIELLNQKLEVARVARFHVWDNGHLKSIEGYAFDKPLRAILNNQEVELIPLTFYRDGQIEKANLFEKSEQISMPQGNLTLRQSSYDYNSIWYPNGSLSAAVNDRAATLKIQNQPVEVTRRGYGKDELILFHPNGILKAGVILNKVKLRNTEGQIKEYVGWVCFDDNELVNEKGCE